MQSTTLEKPSRVATPRARMPRTSSQLYRLRLATTPEEVRAAQALRFSVFNLELNEGLVDSFVHNLDRDIFDEACDHLIVEEIQSGRIVGTYRLQTGIQAGRFHGYYSAREFNFAPFEPYRDQMVELGRACVDKKHRNLVVLGLLWGGIAKYAKERNCRFLIGCSSLSGTDPGVALEAFCKLAPQHLAPPQWLTEPTPEFACGQPEPIIEPVTEPVNIPKLMSAYFSLGAKICGCPAIDREFGTVDFLTLLDLESLSEVVARRYLG
jgi:putative hemolysin